MADKQLLICISDYSLDANASESLDAVLAMAIFDLTTDVYFHGEGVRQLFVDQALLANGKQLAKQWSSAPIYGIEHLWVCENSLAEQRSLHSAPQIIPQACPISHAPNPADYKHHLKF